MKWLFGLPRGMTLFWAIILTLCILIFSIDRAWAEPLGRHVERPLGGVPIPYVPGASTLSIKTTPGWYFMTWAYSKNLEDWTSVEHYVLIEEPGLLTIFLCRLPCIALNIRIDRVPPSEN